MAANAASAVADVLVRVVAEASAEVSVAATVVVNAVNHAARIVNARMTMTVASATMQTATHVVALTPRSARHHGA